MNITQATEEAKWLLENRPRPYQGPFGSLYDDLSGQLVEGADRFRTSWPGPIVSSTLVAIADSVPASGSQILTVDGETGEFGLLVPPSVSLLARYHYLLFSDTQLQKIIGDAVPRFQVFSTIDEVLPAYFPALHHYIRGEGYTMLAGKWAMHVNVSLGPRSEARGSISETYRQLAKDQFELGDKARDEVYTRAGQREVPTQAMATYTSRVWTPRR